MFKKIGNFFLIKTGFAKKINGQLILAAKTPF
jgi:hypothetical protein